MRWELHGRNPAKLAGRNPPAAAAHVRAFTRAEVDAIAAELSASYRPLPAFAAATGLRPEEWQALERRDVDRARRRPHRAAHRLQRRGRRAGEDERSRRQVPLSPERSPRSTRCRPGSTRRCCSRADAAALLNLDNFRRREWAPAIEASGVATPARIYDLRSTFASNALAAGVDVFELARVMGTSSR